VNAHCSMRNAKTIRKFLRMTIGVCITLALSGCVGSWQWHPDPGWVSVGAGIEKYESFEGTCYRYDGGLSCVPKR
jgi:hypothetical protein